jgi:chloramphenicol-sensitive protein RarD
VTDSLERTRRGGAAPARDEQTRGFLLGVAAYVMWGLFPLYWSLLEPSTAFEVLAHRICWSLLAMLALLVALRRTPQLVAIVRDRRKRSLLLLASVVITLNWGGYIWGVTHGKVVETSLGYFINPLVTVLMGVLILGERLRPAQWVAIAIAFAAVVGLTVEYGRPPWIALLLAFSFGTYGLAKKQANVEAVESLTFETIVFAPFAFGFLVWLGTTGRGHFLGEGVGHVLLLASTGVVTALPLLCFGAAAIRVPMTTLGLLQYLAPVLQFALGVTVLHEAMTPMRWAGFALVWVALVIFTFDAVRHHRRRQLRLTAESCAL